MNNNKIYYTIYKISINDNNYIGSTKDFKRRMTEHRKTCNNPNKKGHNYKIYKIIRENGGWHMCNCKILEQVEYITKNEILVIEQSWIDIYNANMNSCSAICQSKIEKIEKEEKEDNPISYGNGFIGKKLYYHFTEEKEDNPISYGNDIGSFFGDEIGGPIWL